jgi:hypothetical protein
MYSPSYTPNGAFVGSYEKSGKRARRTIFIWVIMFLVGLVCIFLLTSRPSAPGFKDNNTEAILALGAVIAGGLGGLLLWHNGRIGFIRPDQTFEVRDDGFIMHYKDGDASYQWSQLRNYVHSVTRHYTNGVHTGDTRLLTLWMDDGKKFVLDNGFKGIKELEELLPKVTFGPLMNRTIEQLRQGQNVPFGTITITPGGLFNGKEALIWEDVAGMNVAKGVITLWARNPNGNKPRKYGTVRFGTLPNAYVFLETVTRLSPVLSKPK